MITDKVKADFIASSAALKEAIMPIIKEYGFDRFIVVVDNKELLALVSYPETDEARISLLTKTEKLLQDNPNPNVIV